MVCVRNTSVDTLHKGDTERKKIYKIYTACIDEQI
jgi:hypothetical protein